MVLPRLSSLLLRLQVLVSMHQGKRARMVKRTHMARTVDAYISVSLSISSQTWGMLTNKAPCRCEQPDPKGNTVTAPPARVLEICEHKSCCTLRGEIHERDKEDKEETDVMDEGKCLDMWKVLDTEDIDHHYHEHNSPV